MNMIETDWWEMGLPEEWDAEQDEETIIVTDEDGIGVIELTVLEKDDSPAIDWEGLMNEMAPEGIVVTPTKLAECDARYATFVDEDDAVRLWLVDGPGIVLVVSYVCDVSDRGMDDSAVDEILSTLNFVKE